MFENYYGEQSQHQTLKQKYKTRMCRHFASKGTCPLDKYCQFAHGEHELRDASDPLPQHVIQ